MNKYNSLLWKAANKYCIPKGMQETENDWETRLIYSICGMMAYASLWDGQGETVSIVHLKERVRRMLGNYKIMYPELSVSLSCASTELEDEIMNQFLEAGVVYHKSYRIAPSMKREELFDNILFQRGIAIDCVLCVSGIGFYSKQCGTNDPNKVKAMFGLEQEKLQTVWSVTLSAASWKSNQSFEQNTEYLRLNPPFSQGYWVNKPDAIGTVSLLRTGMRGSWLYYLYRYSENTMEVSPLPQWRVEACNYRLLACACLSAHGTLPPIEYFEDGALVHVRMNYLLPPRELEFLKLYSWPEKCTSFPCNFKRKISKDVFDAVKRILSDSGYEFKGGIN